MRQCVQCVLCVCLGLVSLSVASAQQADSGVRVGYLYPAGGERGTTLRVLVCGRQVSRATTDVFVSGKGVHCRVVATYSSMFLNDTDQRNVIRQEFVAAARRFTGQDAATPSRREERKDAATQAATPAVEVPPFSQLARRYPYLHEIESPTADGLQLVFYEYFAPQRDRRTKEALGQGVLVEITIDADAAPGVRELRLVTSRGAAPPVAFVVSNIREVCEQEPNDVASHTLNTSEAWNPRRLFTPLGPLGGGGEIAWTWRELPPQSLPVVVNGQIRGGDVDRLPFEAKAGTKIVIDVAARSLIPYLADAVPGWFQPTIALLDPSDKLVAEASSYRNDPDPLLVYEVRESGMYTVVINDSVFRGREDFVYRLAIGEVSQIAPREPLFAPLHVAFGTLEARNERGLNGAVISLPVVVNGVITTPAEVDSFAFNGKGGEQVVIDVAARRLGSRLDATAELVDAAGKIVATNDDRADSSGPNIGLETHHADPYILATLPADGRYTVRIYGADSACGDDYTYRVRISPPQPTVALYTTSSSLSFLSSRTQPITIRAVRLDGFAGAVRVRVASSDTDAFTVAEADATIPADASETTVKVTFKGTSRGGVCPLALEGFFDIDGREQTVNVVAADDREQAFIYHHLIPAESLFIVLPLPSAPRR